MHETEKLDSFAIDFAFQGFYLFHFSVPRPSLGISNFQQAMSGAQIFQFRVTQDTSTSLPNQVQSPVGGSPFVLMLWRRSGILADRRKNHGYSCEPLARMIYDGFHRPIF